MVVPNIFEDRDRLLSADYKSAGSNQIETLKFLALAGTGSYETIHTVTTGKTYFVTSIILSHNSTSNDDIKIATGAAASEVDIFSIPMDRDEAGLGGFIQLNFNTPIKFSSGTRISGLGRALSTRFSLIGWEE